jgi:tRNA modification GTPase
VATLVVDGPDAAAAIDRHFHPASATPAARLSVGRVVLGHWGASGEQVVIGCVAPQRFELHTHGGAAAPAAVRESLVDSGCAFLDGPGWLERDAPDRLSAHAIQVLSQCPTERTALVAWEQVRGALRRELDVMGASLAAGQLAAARQQARQLLDRAALGQHLAAPWRVVLAGRPNVGKSSLINALVGYERAIVAPLPGTTRDLLTARTACHGWPVELIDTAGLRETMDRLEQAGVALARAQLAQADLVLLVLDSSNFEDAVDLALVDLWPQALLVYNKCDLQSPPALPCGWAVSALTGAGIAGLVQQIALRLVPQAPPPGAGIPLDPSHAAGLRRLLEFLESGDLASARAELASGPAWLG